MKKIPANLYQQALDSIKAKNHRDIEDGLIIPKEINASDEDFVHVVIVKQKTVNQDTSKASFLLDNQIFPVINWDDHVSFINANYKGYYVYHDPRKPKATKPKAEKVVVPKDNPTDENVNETNL